MLKFTLFLVYFVLSDGFLLDNKNPSGGQVATNTQYLTLDDKTMIDRELEKIRHDHERSLNILTEQLQQRFAFLEQQFFDRDQNETISNLMELNQELQNNYTRLLRKFEVLQNEYNVQQGELISMHKKADNLEQEITTLKQLPNIHQLDLLQTLQEKIQKLDSMVNVLNSHELVRNQDFIALYNLTGSQINNLEKQTRVQADQLKKLNETLVHNFYNITFRNQNFFALYNLTGSQINNLQQKARVQADQLEKLNKTLVQDLHNITLVSKDNMKDLQSEANNLANELKRQNISFNQKIRDLHNITSVVVLSACTTSSAELSSDEIIKFPLITTAHGIRNVSSFTSTGKFKCEDKGFYYISASLAANTETTGFKVMKNSKVLSYGWHAKSDGSWYRSATAIDAVELQTNDYVWIQTHRSMKMGRNHDSCVTIFKI